MKMKQEHYDALKEQISLFLDKVKQEHGRSFIDLHMDYIEQGLSEKRFRWDLWYVSSNNRPPDFIDELYEYINDTHIETALKRIVKELTEEEISKVKEEV